MKILIVDDSNLSRQIIRDILESAGFNDLVLLDSATALVDYLASNHPNNRKADKIPDLILMDIYMKGMDGMDACQLIKSNPLYRSIQIIIVTSSNEETQLEKAFQSGARDYITKPYKKIELLARINSVLQLKKEIDIRKSHELELLKLAAELNQANNTLKKLSFLDSLTGIANRRYYEHIVSEEWHRAQTEGKNVAIFMIDIDFFKKYNDTYGHLYGDETLKNVATALKQSLGGSSDIVARYGGEEFIVYLPNCDLEHAKKIAGIMNENIRKLQIPHASSESSSIVTISIGISSMIPDEKLTLEKAIRFADKALYSAKNAGRDCYKSVRIESKSMQA